MYPHERSLVKKFEGKPFTILGINSDQKRDELKTVLEKENISWRSWFDGPGTGGPIASQWNVEGWPTLYLIDHKGVIRDKTVGSKDMDKLIDKLVEEAEAAAKTSAHR
jgi:peroxiredoxin